MILQTNLSGHNRAPPFGPCTDQASFDTKRRFTEPIQWNFPNQNYKTHKENAERSNGLTKSDRNFIRISQNHCLYPTEIANEILMKLNLRAILFS